MAFAVVAALMICYLFIFSLARTSARSDAALDAAGLSSLTAREHRREGVGAELDGAVEVGDAAPERPRF